MSESEPFCDTSESFVPFTSLGYVKQTALLWSLGKENQERENFKNSTICKYHLATHKECFDSVPKVDLKTDKRTKCVDPFNDAHFKNVTHTLREVTQVTAVKAKRLGISIPLQSYLCDNCRKKIDDLLTSNDQDSPIVSQSSDGSEDNIALSGASSHAEGLSPCIATEEVNSVLNSLGLLPLTLKASSPQREKLTYIKEKLSEVQHAVMRRLCRALSVEEEELNAENNLKEMLVGNYTSLMQQVRNKLETANRKKTMKLLTLCPDAWSSTYAAQYFGVSRYSIVQARSIKLEKGILGSPTYAPRSHVKPEMLNIVEQFYCDDRFSRLMPGMHDKVSMRNGEYKQKRLVLCNLIELYAEFKKQHPDIAKNIGKSVFISLRPKWCVLAGSSGTHNVCVCVTHQNAKLILRALKLDPSLKEIIPIAVCDIKRRECMMGICDKCPSNDVITEKIIALLRDTRSDETVEEFSSFLEKTIEYKQWTSTDRDILSSKTGTVAEVIDLFVSNFKFVIKHDFIAKQQSEFIKEQKEKLTEKKAIVLMDFSMNYTCVVQDAAQKYHWSKKGVTLHPVVMYFKDSDGSVQEKSICFISEDVKHDVTQVRLYQEKTIAYIKEHHPEINEIIYVTDGCAGQYKNCTAFYNMCQQARKFNIKVTWCFCATSHGKCPCDGIGGLIKREARRASLQRIDAGHILNAKRLFEFCLSHKMSKTIQFIFVEKAEIVTERQYEASLKAVTVPGTRSFHHFSPVSGE